MFAVALIALSLLSKPVFADVDPYHDWVWLNGIWIYTGTDPDPQPPAPVKG
mgnify:CR=1 FL=1